MINSKNIKDSGNDVPESPINKKSNIQKNGNLTDYKKKLLKLHLDEGTKLKKVDDIIKEPEFIECLNFKRHQELTDFLQEDFYLISLRTNFQIKPKNQKLKN